MHGKGKSDQVKIKSLKLMINEKGEIFFGGKEKEIKWMFPFSLPLTTKLKTYHRPLNIEFFQ